MSEKKIPPSRIADQFVVRFPDGLRDKIAEAAKSHNRSMNTEIILRIQQTFEEEEKNDSLSARVEEITKVNQELKVALQTIAKYFEAERHQKKNEN